MKPTLFLLLSLSALHLTICAPPHDTQEPYSCKHPFVSLSTGCYYYEAFDTNWFQASELCISYGGHLAIINDPMENKALEVYLNQTPGLTWVGANALGDGANFYWQPTSQPVLFSAWSEGHPPNEPISSHPCLCVISFFGRLIWANIPCYFNSTIPRTILCESSPT